MQSRKKYCMACPGLAQQMDGASLDGGEDPEVKDQKLKLEDLVRVGGGTICDCCLMP